MENFTINREIEINQREITNCYEFRLQEISLNSELCNNKNFCDETVTSISSYSNHKQRIDAMFDDGKSLISDVSRHDKNRKLVIANQYTHQKARMKNLIENNIQEKIEKMFEEISLNTSSNATFTANECSQKEYLKPFLFSPKNTVKEDFKVTYLGSRPLKSKNINLAGLQSPLQELYFMYKKKPTEFKPGILTICEEGLTMKTLNKEELNPFSTIAVWASVKLAFRAESGILEYAFLPLIANPDGIDKNLLFKQIDSVDKNFIFQNFYDENQYPIFAIVMRNLSLNKQLECHGFICKSSEEAIVIAANLYHALIKKLKRKRKNKEEKIKESDNRINVSNTEEQNVSEAKPKIKMKNPEATAPAKPPRKFYQTERKHTTFTSGSETFDALNHHRRESNEITVDFQNLSQRRGSVPDTLLGNRPSTERKLRRTVSDCGGNSMIVKNQCEGDILTKVAIPRSQSFLNANGPLQRFSRKNKTHAKNEIQSPLGFSELFNEFRLHEGLKSMDEILNVIIDAEGMSFNDLKPIYKDFLLKLAVILTKDELYHRSKVIMKRQKRKNKNCNFRKEFFMSSMGLKKMFNKSTKKNTKNARPSNLEFTSVVVQSSAKHWESKSRKNNKGRSKSFRVKTKLNHRRKLPKRMTSKFHSITSGDSDVIRSIRNINRRKWGHNMSSSGYFSYSDCSYDSENCTCSSTDKCYCTLSKGKLDVPDSLDSQARSRLSCINLKPKINREHDDSVKTCSCDTISCTDSEKCYCMRREIRKFYSKLFRLSDIKAISQTSHFLKRGVLHNANNLRHIENGNSENEKFMLNQLNNDMLGSVDSSLLMENILAKTWRISEKNSKQQRHFKRSMKTELLPIHTLRPDHPIQENLLNFELCSNSEHHNIKKFQDFTKKMGSRNFEELKCCNEDVKKIIRKRNAHSTLKSAGAKRQYNSMRCRNECLSNLTISKPFYRSMSYRTKRFFGSVRSKRNCGDIMNHIKFPNASHSNSSLRFRRRMDVYDSFSENKFLSFQSDSTHHSQRKKGVAQNLPRESYEVDNSSEGFNREKSIENLQRSENEVLIKINHEKLDSALNQTKKKMLVVSARDPKGKVLFMGASNNKFDSVKNFSTFLGNNNTTNRGEALAVKKSAEIASLFSNSLLKQKISHTDFVSDEKENYQARTKSYDLEHSLGYLP